MCAINILETDKYFIEKQSSLLIFYCALANLFAFYILSIVIFNVRGHEASLMATA